jgi:hypothetical protein
MENDAKGKQVAESASLQATTVDNGQQAESGFHGD